MRAPRSGTAPPRRTWAGWCLLAAGVLAGVGGCRSRPAPPEVEAAVPEPSVEAPRAEAAPSCDGLRLVGPTAPWPLGIDGPPPDPLPVGSPRGYYVKAPDAPGAPIFSLRPLLDLAATDADPIPDVIDPDDDRPRFSVEVTPGYRLDGAPCDRIGVVDEWGFPEHAVEAFGTLGRGGRSLALVDSLGREVAVLPALGTTAPPRVERGALPPPRPRVRFDPDSPALVTGAGRLPLAEVFPHGRWYARPAGVRFDGSDLVLVNSCVPYDPADGFCGLESEDGRLLADPPSPLVAHLGVRLVGDSVRVEPFDVHTYWGSAVLDLAGPYSYSWDREPVSTRTYALSD